jgi:putative addiction module component (TIGR02574 family)
MPALPDVKQLSLTEKLSLMEALWDELCHDEEELPVPDWHKEVLDDRIRAVERGRASFSDLESAKARIARRIREH